MYNNLTDNIPSELKELKDNMMLRGDIAETLKKVYDIERLAGKMTYGNANARAFQTAIEYAITMINSPMIESLKEKYGA